MYESLIKDFNAKHNVNIDEFDEFDEFYESELYMEFKMKLNAFDSTLEKKYEKKDIGEHIYRIKLI